MQKGDILNNIFSLAGQYIMANLCENFYFRPNILKNILAKIFVKTEKFQFSLFPENQVLCFFVKICELFCKISHVPKMGKSIFTSTLLISLCTVYQKTFVYQTTGQILRLGHPPLWIFADLTVVGTGIGKVRGLERSIGWLLYWDGSNWPPDWPGLSRACFLQNSIFYRMFLIKIYPPGLLLPGFRCSLTWCKSISYWLLKYCGDSWLARAKVDHVIQYCERVSPIGCSNTVGAPDWSGLKLITWIM